MWMKMLVSMAGLDFSYTPGQRVWVDDPAVSQAWLKAGIAGIWVADLNNPDPELIRDQPLPVQDGNFPDPTFGVPRTTGYNPPK